MKRFPLIPLIALLAALYVAFGGMAWEGWGVSAKPDAVVYTYEKDLHPIPAPVQAALNTLNRQGIVATLDEIDTTDGTNDVPEQYKLSRPAAVEAKLPALVVLGGGKVLRTVHAPTTDTQVLEAAK